MREKSASKLERREEGREEEKEEEGDRREKGGRKRIECEMVIGIEREIERRVVMLLFFGFSEPICEKLCINKDG